MFSMFSAPLARRYKLLTLGTDTSGVELNGVIRIKWSRLLYMLEGQCSAKTHVEMYVEGKLSLKARFFKKNESYVLIRLSRCYNHNNRFYIIIISKWKRNTDVVKMRYTACKTLCYHWDSRLDKKERTQEFSIRFATMKESDPDLKMCIPFEKNFSWWKVWFIYKTSKKIFRCQCEKEMIEWGIGNKHTPERDRRSRSVYIFYCLGTGQIF